MLALISRLCVGGKDNAGNGNHFPSRTSDIHHHHHQAIIAAVSLSTSSLDGFGLPVPRSHGRITSDAAAAAVVLSLPPNACQIPELVTRQTTVAIRYAGSL
ncbi:hypothetical protein H072_9641 [Dactylellina haptotyla CBS 200.50]|uniref:Uncharacterized protein n=1 Tax=Dactylellina haptotyla (strain CBS 200.50) TaxID=1284197 RepID=S8BND8_DACHA|nr:hypothetical protein H072_9641 [Dactylellina haptotyla CBS 200.50]